MREGERIGEGVWDGEGRKEGQRVIPLALILVLSMGSDDETVQILRIPLCWSPLAKRPGELGSHDSVCIWAARDGTLYLTTAVIL